MPSVVVSKVVPVGTSGLALAASPNPFGLQTGYDLVAIDMAVKGSASPPVLIAVAVGHNPDATVQLRRGWSRGGGATVADAITWQGRVYVGDAGSETEKLWLRVVNNTGAAQEVFLEFVQEKRA